MSILNINNISKQNADHRLINQMSLKVEEGQCIVIKCNKVIGSALLSMIIGNTSPSTGDIYFKEHSVLNNYSKFCYEIGISFLEEGLYDRMKVKDYIRLFRGLYSSDTNIEALLSCVGLIDKQNAKIRSLCYSEKKRLCIGRCWVNGAKLILLEEPLQNVDMESRLIIKNFIDMLKDKGVGILATTSSLEDGLLLSEEVYSLDENSFYKVEAEEETDNLKESAEHDTFQAIEPMPIKIEKIPAKVNDKIILFNPTEIIYIESQEGVSYITIGNEKFPCTFTLSELENRLKLLGFFRCHRSYLVNLQRVREVVTWTRNSYSLVLDDVNKTSIPLSKGRFEELKDILGF